MFGMVTALVVQDADRVGDARVRGRSTGDGGSCRAPVRTAATAAGSTALVCAVPKA